MTDCIGGRNHYPMPGTEMETPSGAVIAKCDRCKNGYVVKYSTWTSHNSVSTQSNLETQKGKI